MLSSSASSAANKRSKKLVGGSCLPSPTTTCLPRAIAPQGLDRPHLAGLVEDYKIEVEGSRLQEVGDGKRAHHEDGLDRLDCVAGTLHQLPDGQVSPLLLDLAFQHTQLAAASWVGTPRQWAWARRARLCSMTSLSSSRNFSATYSWFARSNLARGGRSRVPPHRRLGVRTRTFSQPDGTGARTPWPSPGHPRTSGRVP